MSTSYFRIVLILTVVGLSGCSLFPDPGPPPARVLLDPPGVTSHITTRKTLHVEDPTTTVNISGTKIVIRKTDEAGLSIYTTAQGQEWADTLPTLVQRTVVNHFKTPGWPGVVSEARSFLPDYKLSLDIRKFNIILGQGVEVSINATLLDNQDLKVEATRTFDYVITSPHNVRGYVEAFNQAMACFLNDLSGFLRAQLKF